MFYNKENKKTNKAKPKKQTLKIKKNILLRIGECDQSHSSRKPSRQKIIPLRIRECDQSHNTYRILPFHPRPPDLVQFSPHDDKQSYCW